MAVFMCSSNLLAGDFRPSYLVSLVEKVFGCAADLSDVLFCGRGSFYLGIDNCEVRKC